jgi:hypothetical protein
LRPWPPWQCSSSRSITPSRADAGRPRLNAPHGVRLLSQDGRFARRPSFFALPARQARLESRGRLAAQRTADRPRRRAGGMRWPGVSERRRPSSAQHPPEPRSLGREASSRRRRRARSAGRARGRPACGSRPAMTTSSRLAISAVLRRVHWRRVDHAIRVTVVRPPAVADRRRRAGRPTRIPETAGEREDAR